MSKVEEYMHSRLGDFVDSYSLAVQALADVTENYNRLLFLPGSVNLEELALLEKRKEYLEREVRSAAIQLSDFVVQNEHDL